MSETDPTWQSLGISAALAASYAQDTRGFIPLLAGFLETTLPECVTIERQGGFFQKKKTIVRITLTLREDVYTVEDNGHGVLLPMRTKFVRGIRLKTETIPIAEWIGAISAEIEGNAQRNENAALALKELLRG